MIKSLQINKIEKDAFGRIYGILVLNKPPGITSHGLVDRVRKKYKTRRVGHAGALDPFATGIMVILIGKATKLSQHFLNLDKEYDFSVLLGISTDTQDPEGKVTKIQNEIAVTKAQIKKVLESFKENYEQTMPIFSSIKIHGTRLRELAHASDRIEKKEKKHKTYAKFLINPSTKIYKKLENQDKLKNKVIEVELPTRKTKIIDIKLEDISEIKGKNLSLRNIKIDPSLEFKSIGIKAKVSKGTYIRQLAEDIGKRLGDIPAMLYTLDRTRVGTITKKDVNEL
ncbi:hypothetical protein JW766_01825 [Candidatus Dojkabacteria bacterium]|nr:hypothetical protein [Candidatus Dojkabacteria bacterium]